MGKESTMADTTAAAIDKDVERSAGAEDPRRADLFVVGIILVAALAAFALYFWRLATGDAAGADGVTPLLFALSCVYLCFEAPRRRTAGVRAVSVLASVDAVLLCAWALVQVVQVVLS